MVNKKYWCTIICSIMQARICGELQNSSYLVHYEVVGSTINTAWYRWTKNWRLKTLDKIISTMGYNMSRTRWCCLLDFHYHLQLRQQDKVSSLQPLLGIHSRWYYISCWFHVSKLMWIDIRYIICSQLFTQMFIYTYNWNCSTTQRFLTSVRRQKFRQIGFDANSPFWIDFKEKQHFYAGDNLNARWLSGALEQRISNDHVNIAKCRLQLFDLVIADKLYQHAVKKVLCLMNNWKGGRFCGNKITEGEHNSKPDPLNETESILIGAWVERLRPSFEIYDYARILSWRQLNERGVRELPELSELPSYLETLAKYNTNMKVTNAHFKNIKRVSLENEQYFEPPVEFCNTMKQIWSSNPDGK